MAAAAHVGSGVDVRRQAVVSMMEVVLMAVVAGLTGGSHGGGSKGVAVVLLDVGKFAQPGDVFSDGIRHACVYGRCMAGVGNSVWRFGGDEKHPSRGSRQSCLHRAHTCAQHTHQSCTRYGHTVPRKTKLGSSICCLPGCLPGACGSVGSIHSGWHAEPCVLRCCASATRAVCVLNVASLFGLSGLRAGEASTLAGRTTCRCSVPVPVL